MLTCRIHISNAVKARALLGLLLGVGGVDFDGKGANQLFDVKRTKFASLVQIRHWFHYF